MDDDATLWVERGLAAVRALKIGLRSRTTITATVAGQA
jgi:hypothetical protein